jgi:hypothetical protein
MTSSTIVTTSKNSSKDELETALGQRDAEIAAHANTWTALEDAQVRG